MELGRINGSRNKSRRRRSDVRQKARGAHYCSADNLHDSPNTLRTIDQKSARKFTPEGNRDVIRWTDPKFTYRNVGAAVLVEENLQDFCSLQQVFLSSIKNSTQSMVI